MVGISKITPVRVIAPLKVDSKDSRKGNSAVVQKTPEKKGVKDDDTSVKHIDERI